jgi:hypothetical protein
MGSAGHQHDGKCAHNLGGESGHFLVLLLGFTSRRFLFLKSGAKGSCYRWEVLCRPHLGQAAESVGDACAITAGEIASMAMDVSPQSALLAPKYAETDIG